MTSLIPKLPFVVLALLSFALACDSSSTTGTCTVGTSKTVGLLCDVTCVDIQNDPYNCGGCGTRCPSSASCTQGQCACDDAQATLVTNAGTCCTASLATDPDNCGTCGNTCPSGHCAAGVCGAIDAGPPILVCGGTATACRCSYQYGVDGGGGDCGTTTVTDALCCATDGWPTPASGAGCVCGSMTCQGLNADGSGTCECGGNINFNPNYATMTTCSGAQCCYAPADPGPNSNSVPACRCDPTVLPGINCTNSGYPLDGGVPSCNVGALGCAAGSHLVTSCSGP